MFGQLHTHKHTQVKKKDVFYVYKIEAGRGGARL
jgi:hypothetical protein